MADKELKAYHRHGKRYIILCTGQSHWRQQRTKSGSQGSQRWISDCPYTCPNHIAFIGAK